MFLPKVSIIIPAYNEEKDIKDVLDSIMKQNYQKSKLETIVIDDKSTDRTPEIVSQYPVKMIKGKHKGVGAARNLGIKKAKGDIILFVDADQILDKNYVKEIVKPFEDKKVCGVNRMEFLWNKESLIARLEYLKKRLGYEQSPLIPLGAVRRKIVKEVGYIDPSYGMYDDWEFAKRVSKKHKIVRIERAKIWHKEPDNLTKLYRKCKWTGKSTLLMFFSKQRKKAIIDFLFISLNAFLPLYLICLFLPHPLPVFSIIGLMLFLIIEGSRGLKMFRITKWKESFLTPIYDSVYMILVYIGLLDSLIHKELKFGI